VIIAIHQPNYLPWLGYFRKIAEADAFVFLNDVQYSKNSYTNRVRIQDERGARWLTVPVSAHLGMCIDEVRPARSDWRAAHLSTLHNAYRVAASFRDVWPDVELLYERADGADLATINRSLIEGVSGLMGLKCRFLVSSAFDLGEMTADDRLIRLVETVDPGGTYLSGQGGAKYQDPAKFAAAGLGFRYLAFDHPEYGQGRAAFEPGLSALDAAFHLGWNGAAALVTAGIARA
jgi:hypothetical protein